jgi:HPt (histidine-containing phosphotransfer) domain-containing protein
MKYDLEQIANDLDFEVEDVQELIDIFTEVAKSSLELMKIGINENNFEKITQSAHSIKGSSSNILLDDISKLAKEIEMSAKDRLDIDYQSKYKQLKDMI